MKKKNGYFTVEAALVFPMALATVLFVVFMLLFQYDRCLMEQDMGALALWGSRVEAADGEELERLVENRLNNIYWSKYAMWKMKSLGVSRKNMQFSVSGEGELAFPLPGFNFWSGDSVWEAKADFRFWRISPTDFVRLCNRAKTYFGTEDEKGGIEKE